VGLGVAALDARDRFVASGQRDAGARADADTLRTVTNVAWAGAGAFLVAGVTLLATAPWSKPSSPRKPGQPSGSSKPAVARSFPLVPEVTPTGGGVVLRLPL
jgi:hypothetical protein